MRLKFFPVIIGGFFFVCYWILFPSFVFANGEPPATIDQLTDIFGRVISVVAIAGGFLSFIALIIGGFRYITARGDPKAIASAQSAITWAVLGLALIIISWLILKFISDFTGLSQLLKFCIGPSC